MSIASASILLQSFCCGQNVKIPGERNQISAANQIAPDYVSKIQLTPSNLNLRQLKPKSISPRFPSNVYCNFTLDNSNLPLTRSNFCFLLAHFKTILPLITLNGVISAWQIWEKKPVLEVRNIEFISKQPSKFFVFTFLSLQFKFSVHACILCYLVAFPSHPIAYFLASGYLLDFPWRFK